MSIEYWRPSYSSNSNNNDVENFYVSIYFWIIVGIFALIIMILMCRCICPNKWFRTFNKCCLYPLKRRRKRNTRSSLIKQDLRLGCCFKDLQLCAGCVYLYSPINCRFNTRSAMTISDAITRYNDDGYTPPSKQKLFEEIRSNQFVGLVLKEINAKNPNLYLNILPTGSLRERAGVPLPSTSILATDFDLMLIPDAVVVGSDGDEEVVHDQTPTFEIEDILYDSTPKGHCRLRLKKTSLKTWKDLCYERGKLHKNEVDYYLSQLAVYELIKNSIMASTEIKEYVKRMEESPFTMGSTFSSQRLKFLWPSFFKNLDSIKTKFTFIRNGPAMTAIVRQGHDDLVHCDFTFGLYSQSFPKAYQDFFNRRNNENEIFWPSQEVVNTIKKMGCHVVPKPSTNELVCMRDELFKNPYLTNNAVLEWRMSFSMAEALLFDNLPQMAREAFMAFKALIKTHINGAVGLHGHIMKIESYALKTILFWLVERKPTQDWAEQEIIAGRSGSHFHDDEEVIIIPEGASSPIPMMGQNGPRFSSRQAFFQELFNLLVATLELRHLKHFWNPAINLYDFENAEVLSLLDALKRVEKNFVGHLTDEWLECQRCMRFNCCRCYLPPSREFNMIYTDDVRDPCACVPLPICNRYDKGKPKWRNEAVLLDVY